ncbi:MAG TPA: hypothetical protein VK540_17445 [Polyangiaceae bacterium]|nr:hypothetical protein [Polyangiaceae bacterium]
MSWEPMNPTIDKITPASVDNDQHDVTIKLRGAGLQAPLTIVFVESDGTGGVIPCNNVKITLSNTDAQFRICPFLKDGGSYDMYMWLAPPPHVVDGRKGSKQVDDVPVNAFAVKKKVLTVVQKTKRP